MNISDEYLDGSYHLKNPTFHVEDSPWKAGQISKMLERHDLSPASVAEIGCGAGEILVQLSKCLPDTDFSGFELSPQAYALCEQRRSDRVDFTNSDLFEQTGRTPFDVMLCIDVFEHIDDPFSFLRKLKPFSRQFIFHIPLDMNVQMVLRSKPILGVRQSVGHLHYFSRDTALETLKDCGYEIVDSFYTPNAVDRPKSTRARILRAPRWLLAKIHPEMTARILGGYSLLVLAK